MQTKHFLLLQLKSIYLVKHKLTFILKWTIRSNVDLYYFIDLVIDTFKIFTKKRQGRATADKDHVTCHVILLLSKHYIAAVL